MSPISDYEFTSAGSPPTTGDSFSFEYSQRIPENDYLRASSTHMQDSTSLPSTPFRDDKWESFSIALRHDKLLKSSSSNSIDAKDDDTDSFFSLKSTMSSFEIAELISEISESIASLEVVLFFNISSCVY